MDDGKQNAFTTIYTTTSETRYSVIEGIERGLSFRFRYRVKNVNGWSEFSDTSYIYASSVPSAPAKP